MTVNLLKLCVGISSLDELRTWIAREQQASAATTSNFEQIHTTRIMPKRVDELLSGGALYWVIKGNIQCRQSITDLRSIRDSDGISRCQIILDPVVIATRWQPIRAFQGWRYLEVADAPNDLEQADSYSFPSKLRTELALLGLL